MPKLEREGATVEAWSDQDRAGSPGERWLTPRASGWAYGSSREDDVALHERLRHALALGQEGVGGVRASVDAGVVILEGAVPDRATKSAFESLAAAQLGVRGVDNRLCVDWVDATPAIGRTTDAPAPVDPGYLASVDGSPTTSGRRTE